MATRKKIPLIPEDAVLSITADKEVSHAFDFTHSGAEVSIVGSGTVQFEFPISADTLVGRASTDTLTNKTIDANGTGNSISNIDIADLANGTDGELITWDTSGNPTVVATGTATHVLTSNGAGAVPTFQSRTTSGAGVPGSTPTYLGAIYIDTTNLKIYISTGTASSVDWKKVLSQ